VTAIEGDGASGADLAVNAAPWGARLHVVRSSVEEGAARLAPGTIGAVIVDPPRTGLSPGAIAAVLALRAPVIVYVSCDPATLARDAARIVADGYAIASVAAFDLFPNTSHVETILELVREHPEATRSR
jgi:23S rRNA (uracil1939-C5)-methyltransferase